MGKAIMAIILSMLFATSFFADEEENHGSENFAVKKFNDNDVYIMTHNVVRHAVTGEDLYHGMNFADCKAWCECHDYNIVDNIW